MAVPKQRTSKARRDKRRAHHGLTAPPRSICPQCKEPKLPHRVCANCGTYRGREVVETDEEHRQVVAEGAHVHRQVRRDGRLADATLVRADRDDGLGHEGGTPSRMYHFGRRVPPGAAPTGAARAGC